MKINVITRHAVANYGSLLQTYATIKMFEKIECNCKIINYQRKDELKENIGKTLLKTNDNWNKCKLKRTLYSLIQIPSYIQAYRKFELNRKNLLENKVTSLYTSSDELKKNLPDADIYCSGSDQIWGKVGTDKYDPAYFLDFVPEGKKCIAYASSFGKDKICNELENELQNMLKKYSNISVREQSAQEILTSQKILSERVLDPTLMLTPDEWRKIFPPKKKHKRKYILVYQLHNSIEFDNYLKKIIHNKELDIYRICPSFRHIFRKGKKIYIPTVEEFIYYIDNAEYILTDSFHGTIFSILFHKNFTTYLANDTNTRIVDLLNLFKLDNRILIDLNDKSWMENNINWNQVDNILDLEKEKSYFWLENAVYAKRKNINKILNCSGCRCCEKICPKKAIKMIEDEEGFLRPQIDKEKCINCELCYNRCPQIKKEIEQSEIQETFAAKNKKTDVQKNSSSGGIFSAISEYIIKNNGYVCGAIQTSDFDIYHYITDSKEECKKFRGSKYVQSDTGNTFVKVKEYLENKKLVLYSGTPCQIAGLKSFLNKEYDNLITIDLICHGVPSNKLYKKYIKYLENKYNGKIIEYNFRSKDKEVWGTNSKVVFKTSRNINKVKYIRGSLDPYYKNFLDGNIYRENCYSCKYAQKNRISDITLGDYWGIEKIHPHFKDDNGISLIIVNTKKGKKILEKIKDNINMIHSDINEASKYNHNLTSPSIRTSRRDNIYKNIDKVENTDFIKKNLKTKFELKERVKALMPIQLKQWIKKIIRK